MSTKEKQLSGIITGAAQGIGLGLAQKLLENGARVLVNDYDAQALKAAEKLLDPWKANLVLHHGDASKKSQVESMVGQAVNAFGQINMAVANAGVTLPGDFLDFPEEKLQTMLMLNVAGSFFLAQTAAKYMIENGIAGRILFMSSVTAFQAHQQLEVYGMTKAALNQLARNLALTLGPEGITVNCVAPGATLTPRTTELGPEYEQGWKEVIPTGRAATTDDVAHACMYLLSPEARQINGQTLIVDGGWTKTGPLPKHI